MKFNIPNIKMGSLKDTSSVGLDIGSYAVKLVKVDFIKDKPRLSSFLIERYSQPADLSGILKKIAQNQDYKRVNISSSGPGTIIRYADFPKMKEDEFKRALKFEAQKHIPFPLSDVNIDGAILKEDLRENKMLALLAAVKKDFIGPRIKLCEESGFKINVVDIDSIALINAFSYNYSSDEALKNKTVALVNVGAALSNLDILEDGLPHLSRDIHIAGNNATQKIADVFGLDFKAAEEIKTNPDKDKQDKVSLAIENAFSALSREIRISFDFYESQSANSVEKIFLSGSASLPQSSTGVFRNLLGIEAEYWDPFKHMDKSTSINTQALQAVASQLAVAAGLALHK